MASLRKKLKASTLVETLVAMVVILLCIGISTMIYLNLYRSFDIREKSEANILLTKIAVQTKSEKLFLDQTFEQNGFRITKSVLEFEHSENLRILSLKAFNKSGKSEASYNELIVIPE